MSLIKLWVPALILICIAACTINKKKAVIPMDSIRFLALGDSYTIGERVADTDRWPAQLASRLEADSVPVRDLKIIATTGWTTDELIAAIEAEDLDGEWDLVTLLIGVNNQYRGYPIQQYRTEFEDLLQRAIQLSGEREERVVVLSIPDYAYTPFGQEKDPAKITKELDQYNDIAQSIARGYGVRFLNITDSTRRGLDETDRVAEDKLHPSAKEYKDWIDMYYDVFLSIVK